MCQLLKFRKNKILRFSVTLLSDRRNLLKNENVLLPDNVEVPLGVIPEGNLPLIGVVSLCGLPLLDVSGGVWLL